MITQELSKAAGKPHDALSGEDACTERGSAKRDRVEVACHPKLRPPSLIQPEDPLELWGAPFSFSYFRGAKGGEGDGSRTRNLRIDNPML